MTIRAFFAVDLEVEAIKEKIITLQQKLEDPNGRINFVSPENLHFTLKFLGDIEDSLVPQLQKKMREVNVLPFDVELKGIGCLPGFHYINAIYIGVIKGHEGLATIAKEIESKCAQFNLKKENRPFKSHLTIGRVKKIGNKNELITKIKDRSEEHFGTIRVTNFRLKKSELGSTGPTYTNLFEIPLI